MIMTDLPLPEQLEPYEGLIVGGATAILILLIGWIASKWANRLTARVLRARELDEALARFLAALAQYVVLAVTLIAALEEVGVVTTSLVAILGSAGIAIGLALQGNLGHFASGVMILFFRPFSLGDFVTAGGNTGTVRDIGLFATTMHTADNEKIIVPNGTVTSGPIINHTVLGTRRGKIEVGVAYGTDLDKAKDVLEKAAKRAELVLEDPAPAVAFVAFGASSLDMVVLSWSKSADYLAMLHNVKMAIYEDLNAAGIDIPFNQIVVHNA
jgi:small conductance mechanosensitive channel